ncbi:MAG: Stk1 family PASTA domain-containing Ser/Thr kinase [Lachnospiraceae bacterium]
MMLRAGEILGNRYEIIELVGTGGMASVYKAKDHRLNRIVAIKILDSQFGDDQEFIKKFNIEAQSAAAFVHPNIVSIYDVGDENGCHFIVMEYVDGETLKKYIASKGYLDAEQIVSLSIQIASGIKAAHDNKTIHRDIKPQNILILSDGMTAKVTDFGIAKTSNTSTVQTITMGSVHYLPPEQARSGYTDERSDIYSLGITMYEMATGTVPFDGENNVVIALMHLEDDPIPPRKLQPTIPESLEKIILKCIKKRKDDRYQSMEDLIEDLQKVFSEKRENYIADNIISGEKEQDSSTIILTKDDLEKIKREITNPEEEDEEDEVKDVKEIEPLKEDEEGEEEPESVDPKLEKIIIGLTALTLLIIVSVILYFVIRTTGIFHPGVSSKSEPTTVEAAVEDKKTTSTQEKTDGGEESDKNLVPNLIGLKKDNAIKLLEDTDLQIEYIYQYSEIEKDYVIGQSIDAGTKITEGDKIILTISQGSELIKMPNVIGMLQKQAEKELEEIGLKIEYSYEYSKEADVNKILSQSVKPESKVSAGDKVVLTVSLGEAETKIIVPDLSYYTQDEARVQLERLGLKLGEIKRENSDIVAKGQIISQSIEAKQKVGRGTQIDVVISAGVDEENYVYKGNLVIQYPPFSTDEKENANLTLTLIQKDKEKVIYDGLVTENNFPLNIDFEGLEAGEAIVRVQVDGQELSDSYIVQVG